MTSVAQLEANRRNALHSTGPKTTEGKARASQNALRHGFTGRLLVGLWHGPFKDDPEELQGFVTSVVAELDPQTQQEHAEALHIAGCLVRRARLVELEAMALALSTRTPTLPPAGPGEPERVIETDLWRAGAEALDPGLFDRLPRYEAHLSREIERGLVRLERLQAKRVAKECAVLGEVVGTVLESVPTPGR